jgi:hypothetical protein
MQPPVPEPMLDRAPREAAAEQLTARDDAMLPIG